MWTYAPDLDERTPNILLTGSQNVVPTNAGGFRNAYTAPIADSQSGQPSYPDVGAVVVGSRLLLRQAGTPRLFAGTAAALKEANQTVAYAWTDVSRGAVYSGVTQWMFDAYGDTMLAAASLGTRTEIQASTGAVGTAFANLGSAPKARIIVVQSNIVLAFDYDSTGTAVPDGWIGSDVGNATSWTPGTGECVSGRFTETPGSISAAIKQGNGVVVFKNRGLWRGQYVGLPEVWRWELVTESVGCVGPLAVVNVADTLYFLDPTGFWMYDGSRPRRLSGGLDTALRPYSYSGGVVNPQVQIGVDDVKNVLYIHNIVATGGGNGYITFHYVTGAWGPPVGLLHNGTSTIKLVSAVCNGACEQVFSIAGGPTATVLSDPNALKFLKGTGTQGLFRNFSSSQYIGENPASGKALGYSYSIIPGFFGQNGNGAQLTRVYHDLRSYSLAVTATGSLDTTTDTVTAYRRPFSRGTAQSSGTGSYSDSFGYTDVRANGNWFKDTFSQTIRGAATSDSVTLSFEWLGFEPEYAIGPRPKN